RTLGKIKVDVEKLLDGGMTEAEAVKLKRRINSTTRLVDARVKLIDKVSTVEKWERKLWSLNTKEKRFVELRQKELLGITKLGRKLVNDEMSAKEAKELEKKLDKWKKMIDRKMLKQK
ncbi:MAG: hypothetical protein GY947_00880, partial [Rhodobacteraceae bacterium]|nr:hypothetical protein [Paracoccaceae bacterium]